MSQMQNSGLLEDVGKLKKHINLIVDRLGKGMRPCKAHSDDAEAEGDEEKESKTSRSRPAEPPQPEGEEAKSTEA